MKLVKYSPFDMLENPFINDFFDVAPTGNGDQTVELKPITDIYETDDAFLLDVMLPGVEKEKVNLEVDDDQLIITAERPVRDDENLKVHMRESRRGSFKRTFTIGKTIDRENIDAKFENGILRLKLAKREESVARKIDIS